MKMLIVAEDHQRPAARIYVKKMSFEVKKDY